MSTRWLLAIAAALGALSVLVAGSPPAAQAAPTQSGIRYAWGFSASGAAGTGSESVYTTPVLGSLGQVPVDDSTFTDVDSSEWDGASGSTSCGIAGGKAYCWGSNRFGQLGNGTIGGNAQAPVAVSTSGVLSGKVLVGIATGQAFACALDSQGLVYCWGKNSAGQLGDGSGADSLVPVAVTTSGTLQGVSLRQVSAGENHVCAIDDTVYCWGSNASGQLGQGTSGGFSSTPVTVSPTALGSSGAKYVSAGGSTTCAVTRVGSAFCWGANAQGVVGSGDTSMKTSPTPVSTSGVLNGVQLSGISTSSRVTCAWDDSAYCWGNNQYGVLGQGSWSPSSSTTPLAVKSSGVLLGKDIELVSTNGYTTCALDSEGAAYCWGLSGDGQSGTGSRSNLNEPTAVSGGLTFLDVSVGDHAVIAVTGPYQVTYDANQADAGSVPPPGTGVAGSEFTVASNSGNLARDGFTFAGWNSRADGLGTAYAAGTGTFTLTGNTTLYAKWQALPPPPPPPPPPSPPGPPYLLTAEPGNRQVTLTWARPDWEGTSPVTAYRVYAAPGGLVCTVSVTTCAMEGLTNGQPYEFWVTAINAAGESSPSRRLTAIPKPDPPSAPYLASANAGNAKAILEWDPPTSDGGSPVTEYRVFTGSGTRVCTVTPPTEQCTVEGLINGQRYEFWVTAVNAAGESPQSRRLSVTPAIALPGPPLDVAGTAGDKRIHWAWRPPEGEGSYPVERYQVILNPLLPTVGGIACTVSVPETSCTVPKLTPGTTYTARVRAWSKAGWGPWSTSSTGVKVPTPPPPGISVEVRRLAKDPDDVRVKGRTQGIKPGAELWVWIHRETEYGYMESFQGTSRPVVKEDGDFTWERSAPEGRTWEVTWCTQPNVKGICSRWTLL